MISKDDMLAYTNAETALGFAACYVCSGKLKIRDNNTYEIRQVGGPNKDYKTYSNNYRCSLVFHKECFMKVAGEEFIFADD